MVTTPRLFSADGTTRRIKRHLSKLPHAAVFPTRLFLVHGYRSAVDRCLARLVIQGRIVRVTRGVYMKAHWGEKSKLPSIEEVARVKARAFGKEIYVHGATAAIRCGFNLRPHPLLIDGNDESYKEDDAERRRLQFVHLKLIKPDEDYVAASAPQTPTDKRLGGEQITQRIFAVAGKTTSFMYGKVKIVLKGTAHKYLKLGDSVAGLFLRGLLYKGKDRNCWTQIHSSPILLRSEDKRLLRVLAWQMPSWLSDQFFAPRWKPEALVNNCLA